MSFAIPVKRLCEPETLMAFDHPKPLHAFHGLWVPKSDEFQLAAYRLIVNGGEHQDFSQLHFRWISDVIGAGPSRLAHGRGDPTLSWK